MLYAIVAVLALILDQAVKYWTTANIVLNTGEKAFLPGIIHLANVHNDGAAFSILEGQRWFFVVLCVVFVAVVTYMLAKNIIHSAPARWTAVLVMAGAVGNCIDRIINGYVVDMFELEFPIFGRAFPVFNVADIFITVCGILFCIFFLLEPTDDTAKKNIAKAAAAMGEAEEPIKKAAPAKKGKRAKIEIPDFPQRPKAEVPEHDPNDPFAEWERIAFGEAAKAEEMKADAMDAPVEEAPADALPAEDAPLPGSEVQVEEIRSAAEPVAHPLLEETPVIAVEVAPKVLEQEVPEKPAQEEEISFNLDDILAEFRDL